MATLDSDSGPYHGPYEWPARLIMIPALGLIAVSVVQSWYLHVRHGMAVSSHWLVWVDVWGLCLALNLYALYRRLSAKIAEGGPAREFLDEIRAYIAVLAILASMLLEVPTGSRLT